MGLVLGGGGETGSRALERNQKQMVLWWGPRAGKVPTVAWAVPPGHWALGHLGEWAWGGPRCGRTGPPGYSLTLTPACLLGQRWHPGVSGAVCWSGSSRTAGTNGAQARTARRTTSPLGPPTVSAHAARMLWPMVSPGNSCPEGASSLHLGLGWAKRSKGSGARAPLPSPVSDSVPSGTDSSIPAFQVLSSPLSLGTWVG